MGFEVQGYCRIGELFNCRIDGSCNCSGFFGSKFGVVVESMNCRIDELFNCLTEWLVGVRSSRFGVWGCCRIGESFNCRIEGLVGVRGSKFEIRGCCRTGELFNCLIVGCSRFGVVVELGNCLTVELMN